MCASFACCSPVLCLLTACIVSLHPLTRVLAQSYFRCAELVRRYAPYDHRLYTLAKAHWRARHGAHTAGGGGSYDSVDHASASTATSTNTPSTPASTALHASASRTSNSATSTLTNRRANGSLSARVAPTELRWPMPRAVAQRTCAWLSRSLARSPPLGRTSSHLLPRPLAAALIDISGVCTENQTIGGSYSPSGDRAEDDLSVETSSSALGLLDMRAASSSAVAGREDIGAWLVRTGRGPPAVLQTCPQMLAWPELLTHVMSPADRACKEVRVTFAFSVGSSAWRVLLPLIRPRSPCNIALADSMTLFKDEHGKHLTPDATNWTIRRIPQWPWPNNPHRSTHVMKTLAPLLFPFATSVLWGDIKCSNARHGQSGHFPCAALRSDEKESDLVVPMNRSALSIPSKAPKPQTDDILALASLAATAASRALTLFLPPPRARSQLRSSLCRMVPLSLRRG